MNRLSEARSPIDTYIGRRFDRNLQCLISSPYQYLWISLYMYASGQQGGHSEALGGVIVEEVRWCIVPLSPSLSSAANGGATPPCVPPLAMQASGAGLELWCWLLLLWCGRAASQPGEAECLGRGSSIEEPCWAPLRCAAPAGPALGMCDKCASLGRLAQERPITVHTSNVHFCPPKSALLVENRRNNIINPSI
jgi:hypothetical protein